MALSPKNTATFALLFFSLAIATTPASFGQTQATSGIRLEAPTVSVIRPGVICEVKFTNLSAQREQVRVVTEGDAADLLVRVSVDDNTRSILIVGKPFNNTIKSEKVEFIRLKVFAGSSEVPIIIPYEAKETKGTSITEVATSLELNPGNAILDLEPGKKLDLTATIKKENVGFPEQSIEWSHIDLRHRSFVWVRPIDSNLSDKNGSIKYEVVSNIDPDSAQPEFVVLKAKVGNLVETLTVRLKKVNERGDNLLNADYYVMSEKEARDVFGRNVAEKYYAIGVSISNNTQDQYQISSMAFEKGCGQNSKSCVRSIAAPFGVVAAVQERRKLFNARTLLMTGISALGNMMTGFTPFFFNVGHRDRFTTFTNILTVPGRNSVESVFPNSIPTELRNLEALGLHGTRIVEDRLEPMSGVIFVSRDNTEIAVNSDGKKIKLTPAQAKEKLGDLVVRGIKIERPQQRTPQQLNITKN